MRFKLPIPKLQDGRCFLTGSGLTIADIIGAMKTLRLAEYGFPFKLPFPAYFEWFMRICERLSFKEGIIRNHNSMSQTSKLSATLERLLGGGLRREVLKHVA